MENKYNKLQDLKNKINIEIEGTENYPQKGPSLIIANHTCLMDIFYLPMALPEAAISLISPRLIYKNVEQRKQMVNDYLYAMPIEAHGGKVYANLCLNQAIEMLKNGHSVSIFPEGAYVEENDSIYRGRTGMSRILYESKIAGINTNLVPVAIYIESKSLDLDGFIPTNDKIKIKILTPINYESALEQYTIGKNDIERNEALHQTVDKSLKSIANHLNKPYKNEYIKLYPKNNVIFQDGTTIPTNIAQEKYYIEKYQKELETQSKKLCRQLKCERDIA